MAVPQWVGSSTPYLDLSGGDVWGQEAAAQGRTGRQRIVYAGEAAPPPDVATLLSLQPGEPAILRRRVILLDDHPVEIADSYWPTRIAAGTPLAEPGKIRGGAVAYLAAQGYRPATVDEEIDTRLPTADEKQLLPSGDGDWVLVLTRRIADSSANPYEVSVMVTPGRSRRLHYSMKVD